MGRCYVCAESGVFGVGSSFLAMSSNAFTREGLESHRGCNLVVDYTTPGKSGASGGRAALCR